MNITLNNSKFCGELVRSNGDVDTIRKAGNAFWVVSMDYGRIANVEGPFVGGDFIKLSRARISSAQSVSRHAFSMDGRLKSAAYRAQAA